MIKKKLKIVHVVPSLNILDGGIPRIVSNYCKLIQKEKHIVSVYYKKLNGTKNLNIDKKILKIIDNYKNKIFFLLSLKTLKKKIEKMIKENNFIHIHGIWDPITIFVAKFAKKNSIPYAVSIHGMLEKWSLDQKFIKKKIAWYLFQKNILLNASAIIVASEKEYKRMMFLGFKKNIFHVSYPINQNKNFYLKKNKNDNKNITEFLFLSRLHKKKGIENLIDAFKNIKSKNWKLKIVGSSNPFGDKFEKKLKLKVKNYNLNTNIKFYGNLVGKDKIQMYKNSDVFILPTYSENFGLVVTEALNYCLPVITTKYTPWSDLGKNGCWIIESSVESITTIVSKVIRMKKKKLKMMGIKGKKYLAKNYNNSITTKKLIDIYHRAH